MTDGVVLTTERLVLRRMQSSDAPAIYALAGNREVAMNTLTIPHPYPDGAAEEWIERRAKDGFAITLRDSGELVGSIGIHVDADDARGEVGYWIGVPHWGRGYASEAAKALIDYAFETLELNKVHAAHFARNPASGRVMQKLGMTYEGTLRQHHNKWGEYVDVAVYSILRSEWRAGLITRPPKNYQPQV